MFQVVYILIQENDEDDRHGDGKSRCLFFLDMIFGTTGLPYIIVIFHLWTRVKCDSRRVPSKFFNLAILVSLTNISKMSLECKN